MSEIERLRAEYLTLHHRVLELGRQPVLSHAAEMRDLQRREEKIVTRLRQLGAGPYSGDSEIVLHRARAL